MQDEAHVPFKGVVLEAIEPLPLPIAIKIARRNIPEASRQIREVEVVRAYSEHLFLETRADRPNLDFVSLPYHNLVLAIAIYIVGE